MKITRVKIIPYNAKIVFSKYISYIYVVVLLCFKYIYWHSNVVLDLKNTRIFNEVHEECSMSGRSRRVRLIEVSESGDSTA